MKLTIKDFKKISKLRMVSKCGKYELYKESDSIFYYPFIDGCRAVHISYDYSMNFEETLEVLNMVIDGTWKHGKGRYLNGLKNSGIAGAINNFSKVN